jgi:hypothetical protein
MSATFQTLRAAGATTRTLSTVLLVMLASSCRDATAPVRATAPASLRIVSGGAVSDTLHQWLPQPIVVEVRDSAGAAMPGVRVEFTPIPGRTPFGSTYARLFVAPPDTVTERAFHAATTDAQGHAAIRVGFSIAVGRTGIVIEAPEGGLRDTAWYTVLPGAPDLVTFPNRDTALVAGGTLEPRALVMDRFRNVRDDKVELTVGGALATVDAAGAVHAGDPGRGWVSARVNYRVDTMRVSVVPQATMAVVMQNADGSWSLSVVSLDGQTRETIVTTRTPVKMPAWNRAGTEIAYNSGSDGSGGDARLYVASMSGDNQRVLPTMPVALRTAYFPRFSPDGQWIYFTGDALYPGDPQGYWTSATTWRVRRDGSGVERLLPSDPTNIYTTAWEPDPTPDGTALILAYAGLISRYDLATRTVTSLGPEGELPRLSPAGDQIAYFLVEPGLISPIYLMRTDGSGVRVLTPGHKYGRHTGYSWSPDGQWLVARGSSGLELVRVSTGEIIPLPYSGAMSQPAFRP